MYKLQLFFEFFEIRKSKHSLSYVSLFMMRKNRKEQNLVRQFARDGTLVLISRFLKLLFRPNERTNYSQQKGEKITCQSFGDAANIC